MASALNTIKEVIRSLWASNKAQRSQLTLRATGNSWKDPSIPAEQLNIVVEELEMLRSGDPPSVYTVAAEALNTIPGTNTLSLLDVGCASGYYYEVISTLAKKKFEYTGADYSQSMLNLARKRYPDTKFKRLDIRHIDLSDKSYDVVFTGAVIVHVKEWKDAVRELARITKSYLVLHRTPITNGKSCKTEEKSYAGVPILFNTFNKDELMDLLSECGCKKIFELNVYPDGKKGLGYMTYVFERIK